MSTHQILKGARNIPDLNRNSYLKWCKIFHMSLITLGIEDYILTEIVELEGSQKSSNTTEQKVTDNNVKSAIIQLVPDDIYHVVESLPTAFEMWNAIRLYLKNFGG